MSTSYAVKTERLGLRLWNITDIGPFSDINADPEVMQYFPALLSKEKTLAMMDRIDKQHDNHTYGLYATEIL